MGGQNNNRGTSTIPQYLLDRGITRVEWWEQRRILRVDITYQGIDNLSDVVYGDWVKQYDPCIILEALDMGNFTTHFIGACVDGAYCSSGISSFVYDLMISCCEQ